jgi:pyrroloquinoline quinone biosynthesis protein B
MCQDGRDGKHPSRDQDCLAVSATGEAWYLLNASPDLRSQVLAAPDLAAGPGRRDTPIKGVLLTDSEIDHALGLFLLREGSGLQVWATAPVLAALETALPIRGILGPYSTWTWHETAPNEPFTVDDGRLQITAIPVGQKRPRYASAVEATGSWVVAYRVEDTETGGVLLYAPCLAEWPAGFDDIVAGVDCVFVDGTFYSPDEMTGATGSSAGQKSMGHVPVGGPDGSLVALRRHPGVRRFYTHLNNTNPLLADGSPEHREVTEAGVEVPADGTELYL